MALANETAEQFLDVHVRIAHHDEIVIAVTMEYEHDWAFGYNTRAFVEDGDITKSLIGNGPVVVPKDGGEPYLASSSSPLDEQLGPRSGFVSYITSR